MNMKRLPILLGACLVVCVASFAQTPPAATATSTAVIEQKSKALTTPDRDKVSDLTNAVLADDGVVGPVADTFSPLTKTVAVTLPPENVSHSELL